MNRLNQNETYSGNVDWSKQQIAFCVQRMCQAPDIAVTFPFIKFELSWTHAGWPFRPFIVVQVGKQHFQIGWLY